MQSRITALASLLGLVTGVWLLLPAHANAQESPWSIGFQATWPAYGASAKYDVNEKLSAQAIVATGTLTNISGRANWEFENKEKYDWFAYGSVGFFRWGGNVLRTSETSVGLGGGAGIELDWRAIFDDSDFPSLFSTVELGLGYANFEYYSFSTLSFGFGLHYHF